MLTRNNASLMNAVTLIACGLWAFLSLEKTSYTALIPVAFGLALMACYPGMRVGRIWSCASATGLTAMILIALWVPWQSAYEGGASLSLFRLSLMMTTSAVALLCLLSAAVPRARRALHAGGRSDEDL